MVVYDTTSQVKFLPLQFSDFPFGNPPHNVSTTKIYVQQITKKNYLTQNSRQRLRKSRITGLKRLETMGTKVLSYYYWETKRICQTRERSTMRLAMHWLEKTGWCFLRPLPKKVIMLVMRLWLWQGSWWRRGKIEKAGIGIRTSGRVSWIWTRAIPMMGRVRF